jgi:multiple sugar transport system substrate-binding protein
MNKITLKGITWNHSRGYDPLIAASKEYLKNTSVKVEWEIRSLKDFGDQSLTDLANQFDLLINDHPHSGVAASTQCVLALDNYLSEVQLKNLELESAGPSFSSYQYEGHQWALPIDAAFQSACFRDDLFKYESPKSWEEAFLLSNLLKKEGYYIGMSLCPTDALCSFLSLTAQLGSPIKEGNKQLVKEYVGLKALELLRRMRDEFHPNSLDWNPIQLFDHMAEKNEIIYAPLAFNYTNYSRKDFRKNQLVFTNSPGGKTLLGGAGIAISSKCINISEAVKYAQWICSSDIQRKIYVESNGQPGNIIAWKDQGANDLTRNFFSNTLESLNMAYVRPRYNGWPAFQEYLGNEIHDHLKNNTDPKRALNKLQEAYVNSYI